MLDSSDKQKVIKFIKASLNTELKSMLFTPPISSANKKLDSSDFRYEQKFIQYTYSR